MANRYWVNGSGVWDGVSTSNWSTASGGAAGASVPGASDAVFFDANSGTGTITLTTSPTVQTLNCTGYAGTLGFGTNTISLNTSGTVFTGSTTMTVTGTPKIFLTYSGAAAVTLSSAAVSEANAISFVVTAGSYALTVTSGNVVKDFDFSNSGTSTFNGSIANTAFTVYGSLTLKAGLTVTAGANAITLAGTSGTKTVTTAGLTLATPITFNGSGSVWSLQDNLTLSGVALTATNGTLFCNSKSVTAATMSFGGGTGTYISLGTGATWTVTGASFTGGANLYLKGTGTINMTSASAKSFAGGNAYYPWTLNQAGAGALTISGSNSFADITNTYSATGATTVTFTAGTSNLFYAFNLTGTAGNVCTLNSTTATQAVLKIAGGVWNVGANSTNGGGNTNLNFVAGSVDYLAISNIYGDGTSRYWVGGSGTWDTTTTTNWAYTSGGAGGARVPTVYDDVFFDQAGTYSVTCTGARACNDVTVSAGTVSFNAGTSPSQTIRGSLLFNVAVTFGIAAWGPMTFTTPVTGKFLRSNGSGLGSTSNSCTINAYGGSITLSSALVAPNGNTGFGNINVLSGTFDTAGYSVTIQTAGNSINISGGSFIANNSTIAAGRLLLNIGTAGEGTLDAGSATFNLFGTGVNTPVVFSTGTFIRGTSQINVANNNTTQSATFSGGGYTFYNVAFTGQSLSLGLNGANTFNTLSFANQTSGIPVITTISADQTTGTLTLGAGTNAASRLVLLSSVIGTPRTITASTFTAGAADIDFRDIVVAGAAAPISGTRFGDCGGNSGITFPVAKTVYWNLAAGGNWSAAAWALTGGGTPSVNNLPLAQDTAIIQATGLNSGTTITMPYAYQIGTLDMSARTSNTVTFSTGTQTPVFYGNLITGTGVTYSGTGTITFGGRSGQAITSAGRSFTQPLQIACFGSSVTLQDALVVGGGTGTLTLANGTLAFGGYTATAGLFSSNNTNTRALDFGVGGTLTLQNSSTTAWNTTTSTNFTASGSGTISMTAAGGKTFVGNGLSLPTITLNQGGAGALTVAGSNTFSTITASYLATASTTIFFNAGTTQTVSSFTTSGSAGKLLTLYSATAGSAASLSITGLATPSANYLVVRDMNFLPLPTANGTLPYRWYLGANSTNNGNNLGGLFISGGTGALKVFQITNTATTTWLTPNDWDSSNNTVHLIGAGGGSSGARGNFTYAAGAGGGGGGYRVLSNFSSSAGTLVPVAVGLGGTAGANGGGTAGTGGTTSWNLVNTATGGTGGTTGNGVSTGGVGGTGTFTGGNGGAGATGTTGCLGGGGGGGAAGPLGNGANGGNGYTNGLNTVGSGGGGGGNGGGSNGATATSGTGGVGGNNASGVGGGAANTAGTFGGGGGGMSQGGSNAGVGGFGIDIYNTIGGGGGGGGAGLQSAFSFVGAIGNGYGSGAGGSAVGSAVQNATGAAGAQGLIVIAYVPLTSQTYTGTLVESAAASDAISVTVIVRRQVSETATVADAVSNSLVGTALVSETVTGTDTLTTNGVLFAATTDETTGTDTVVGGFAFTRAVFESASVADVANSVVQFATQVSEAATAADVDAAIATFNSHITETASEVASATGAGSVLVASTADSASGADLVLAVSTVSPNISETATVTGTPSTKQTSYSVVQELASAIERLQGSASFVTVVTEQASGLDSIVAQRFVRSVIAEAAAVTTSVSSRAQFSSVVSETGTATGSPRVAPSIFNAPVVEQGQVFSYAVVAPSVFNAPVVEAAVLAEVLEGRFLWNLIDDSQTSGWGVISNTQTPGWTGVDDSQDPNWQNINTL